MKQKLLTANQAQTLILALLGVEPYLKYMDTDGYEVTVKLVRIESVERGDLIGVEVDFHLIRFGKMAHHPDEKDYQLFIAHCAKDQTTNPSFIWPARREEAEDVLEPLCNLVFVTDKLRTYDFW